ncbi:hypothetical protein [Thermococcus peptonophilus]
MRSEPGIAMKRVAYTFAVIMAAFGMFLPLIYGGSAGHPEAPG